MTLTVQDLNTAMDGISVKILKYGIDELTQPLTKILLKHRK